MRHLILLMTLIGAVITLAEPASADHYTANEHAERAIFQLWLGGHDHRSLVVAKHSYRSPRKLRIYYYCDDRRHGHRRHVHYDYSFHYDNEYDWSDDYDDDSDSDIDSDSDSDSDSDDY